MRTDRQYNIGEPGQGCKEQVLNHHEFHLLESFNTFVDITTLVQPVATNRVNHLDVARVTAGGAFENSVSPLPGDDRLTGGVIQRGKNCDPQSTLLVLWNPATRSPTGNTDISRHGG
ncbi:hypothetical protein ES707_12317 [subsurface metagenome]